MIVAQACQWFGRPMSSLVLDVDSATGFRRFRLPLSTFPMPLRPIAMGGAPARHRAVPESLAAARLLGGGLGRQFREFVEQSINAVFVELEMLHRRPFWHSVYCY